MVRTKGDGAVTKVVGAKAPRKQLVSNGGASSSASSPDPAKKKLPSSGLPYCPQPTPEWQKSVKSFFKFTPRSTDEQNSKLSDQDEENKENAPENGTKSDTEIEEVHSSKSARKKGKAPANGKTKTKKSSSKKDKGSQSEEEEMEQSEPEKEELEKEGMEQSSSQADDANSKQNDSDNDKQDFDNDEPVQKRRNVIESSDEDD